MRMTEKEITSITLIQEINTCTETILKDVWESKDTKNLQLYLKHLISKL